jgi:nicotinate-nucleotide adenylyltransferase
MRYAILGGSFNPVHIGHLFLADAALSELGYDRVILIPAFTSPFKSGAEAAPAEDRLEMLLASIAGDPRITVDDCEIRRTGISYTIDTLLDIEARYRPEGKLGLILGDDLVGDFSQWKRINEIVERVDIIVAHRRSAEGVALPYPFRQLNNDILELSSGSVREHIQNHGPWRYLVPAGARLIIEERGLYGYAPTSAASVNPAGLSAAIVHMEHTVRSLLNPVRFLQSRNTALLAFDLCARFGLDPQAGYLAGITHDMCKSCPETDLLRLAEKDGGGISKLERKKPSLLHGRAAAVLLGERFGIADAAVIEAVRLHTVGAEDMGALAKIVYTADKIEVSREQLNPVLRTPWVFTDLDSLFGAVLDNTVAYLRSRKLDISEGTLGLLEKIHT